MEATDVASTYRRLVAAYLEAQADWRRSKAKDWPDDPRNELSADGLEKAAEYVRDLEDSHFRFFVRFDEEMRENYSEHWTPDADTGVLSLDEDGARIVSRFWFDAPARAFDFEWLLTQVLDGFVRGWRDVIEEVSQESGFNQPAGQLVQVFEDYGAPLWEDHEDEDGDGE